MPILPRSPTASAVPLGSCELWPFRTHQPNGNGSHHWESNGISNNLQDAPKNPAHLSLDTVSTIKLWLLPIFGNTISMVDVGFVNQNSGFINKRFDNQGSTTKVSTTKNGGFVNQGSSTKKSDSSTKKFVNQKVGFVNQKRRIHQPRFVNQGSSTKVRQPKSRIRQPRIRQPKGWIRQPKTADSSTKVRQPRFVNQGSSTKKSDSSTKDSSTKRLDSSTKNGGFINQGSSTKNTDSSTKDSSTKRLDFVNQKRRIRQPSFVNQNNGFVNQSIFRSTLNTGYIRFGHV